MPLDAAKSRIRNAGMRCTAARVNVLQCLADQIIPMSPVDVSNHLEQFGFDKSTIYRTLTEFTEAGITVRLDLGDTVRRFELLTNSAADSSEHPHFMCVECGEIRCLSEYRLELTPIMGGQKLLGEISEMLVKGRCPSCVSN